MHSVTAQKLVALNIDEYPELTISSKLKKKTELRIPQTVKVANPAEQDILFLQRKMAISDNKAILGLHCLIKQAKATKENTQPEI